jgi:hypothetical protein
MKKHLITLVAASGFALVGTTVATAAPQDPCANNPTTLCDGNIVVTDEPAGLNCTYGGIAITVQRGAKDGIKEMGTKEPPKGEPVDPADETFYVCNGAPGTNGSDGPAGAPGPIGEPGGPGTTPPTARKCTTSVRTGARVYLPPALRGNKKLRLTIQGPSTTRVRFDKNVLVRTLKDGRRPFVFVPLRNRNCGSYIITVRAKGAAKPVTELWNITGLYGLNRQRIR